jgi:hypothetical protein
VLLCHLLLEFLSPILTEQIANQENFIITLLSNAKAAVLHAVSARQIQIHVLGVSMIIYMLILQINVSQKRLVVQLESKILISVFAENAVSSVKHAQTIQHVLSVFQITAWQTKNAILLEVAQKALHITELIAHNALQTVLHAFQRLNAIIVWKHFI